LPIDSQWSYRFQRRKEYPEDHIKYTKMLCQRLINPEYSDWHVIVSEAPSLEDPKISRIVAFSVWDISYINKLKNASEYKPQDGL
jgi:hypothetical protein